MFFTTARRSQIGTCPPNTPLPIPNVGGDKTNPGVVYLGTKRHLLLRDQHHLLQWFDLAAHFIAETNSDLNPFWTADPRRVLAAVKRGKQALESFH
jgi:hypothetical protein